MSECANCRIYMALYAAERLKKPTNYGKMTKTQYRSYKKMPKRMRPPFYVKRCYGEYVVDDNNRVHFYEVEELTTGDPFKLDTNQTPAAIQRSTARLKQRKTGYSHWFNRPNSTETKTSSESRVTTPETPIVELEPLLVDPEHYLDSRRAFLKASNVSESWSCDGSVDGIESPLADADINV